MVADLKTMLKCKAMNPSTDMLVSVLHSSLEVPFVI